MPTSYYRPVECRLKSVGDASYKNGAPDRTRRTNPTIKADGLHQRVTGLLLGREVCDPNPKLFVDHYRFALCYEAAIGVEA